MQVALGKQLAAGVKTAVVPLLALRLPLSIVTTHQISRQYARHLVSNTNPRFRYVLSPPLPPSLPLSPSLYPSISPSMFAFN